LLQRIWAQLEKHRTLIRKSDFWNLTEQLQQSSFQGGKVRRGIMDLQQRWEMVQERIHAACARAGRNPAEVQVVAVTKYASTASTKAVLDLGLNHLGENQAQAGAAKHDALNGQGVWHFIGHLQTNKVKMVLGRFAYIHSLDRLSLAEEIEKRAQGREIPCFVQVNVSGEQTKFGISPKIVLEFVEKLCNMRSIRVAGLMTMAPRVDRPEEARPYFYQLREIQGKIREAKLPNITVEHLSMGMSGDFEAAIEEGATFIRLGSILVDQDLKK
jgi:hypothetical protein